MAGREGYQGLLHVKGGGTAREASNAAAAPLMSCNRDVLGLLWLVPVEACVAQGVWASRRGPERASSWAHRNQGSSQEADFSIARRGRLLDPAAGSPLGARREHRGRNLFRTGLKWGLPPGAQLLATASPARKRMSTPLAASRQHGGPSAEAF
ncbi:uncharacterized protein BDZ99DRAFT_518199 [Mytilinidion resinicola]|uniref:Uncharacterized protein n=1 Tax=Mytilinidion resinicola TaxID=574789 RepID=A0A6A6YUB4_9PEZI|nr:uncharacterized protein BDZ99DRAFT_518199 [Mytilinidion resinicola]KAF2812350.1 hypothetical protein BDZ99DRAFT_518199 [Mytilinidion resinicola]